MDEGNIQNFAGGIQDPNDLTYELRITLTLWADELYRLGMSSSLEVFNDETVAGKLVLYYEFHKEIRRKVRRCYRLCVEEHFMNADGVEDYLGFRVDARLVEQEIEELDVVYARKFKVKIACDLGFELIRDDDEITTEEWDSSAEPEECETLNEF